MRPVLSNLLSTTMWRHVSGTKKTQRVRTRTPAVSAPERVTGKHGADVSHSALAEDYKGS